MWRKILKDIGEILTRLHAGLFVAGIGAVVAVLNFDKLIKATSSGEYIGLVLFWTVILIVLSVIGELGCKYCGRGLIWLSDYYPNWYYFPSLGLSCQITSKKEIELRVINKKKWQTINIRAEFFFRIFKVYIFKIFTTASKRHLTSLL